MNDDSSKAEPGSPEWWRSPACAPQGPADTILRLLEQEEISRRKALELLAYLYAGAPQNISHALPPAPWEQLNWCDDRPVGWRGALRVSPAEGATPGALLLEHRLSSSPAIAALSRCVREAIDALPPALQRNVAGDEALARWVAVLRQWGIEPRSK